MLLPHTSAHVQRRALREADYTLMLDTEGETWMNLAQEITEASLQLYRPSTRKNGRAHRYETLFRTGVEALKSNTTRAMNDEERVARVAGALLKRLERLLDNRQQGFGPIYGEQRTAAVQRLAELLVVDLFHNACGQSVAKLTHEENTLADAIYFLTQQEMERYWAEKHKTPQDDEGPDVLAQGL